MKLKEIYLNESESNNLAEIVEAYNKDRPYKDQKTFQEYAEEILKDAIYYKWKMMKSHK